MTEQSDDRIDPVAEAILTVLEASPNGTTKPKDVAEYLADIKRTKKDPPDLWRRYMMAVKQQAKFLARAGAVDIIRKGEAVDPHAPIKGLFSIRLAEKLADNLD